MDIHKILPYISIPFRRKRMRAFEEQFGVTSETTILDVGGALPTRELIQSKPQVTLLNLTLPTRQAPPTSRALLVTEPICRMRTTPSISSSLTP